MQAYIFSSLAQAQQAVGIMDGAFGPGPFPKAGTDIGAGLHVPAAQSVTQTYGAIWQNAAGTQWAYVNDTETGSILPLHMPVPGAASVDFSSTGNWAGATQVWP